LKDGIAAMHKTDPVLAAVFKESKPVLFSSLFALFGKMASGEIPEGELKEYYIQFKENFPQLKTQQDFLHWSKMEVLENHLADIIKKERLAIIVRKPATELIAKIKKRGSEANEELIFLQKTKEALAKSKDTIDREIKELEERAGEIKTQVTKTECDLRETILTLCSNTFDAIISERDAILRDDVNNFPEKRFLQTNDSYVNDCKRFIEDKLMIFRSGVTRRLKTLGTEIYAQYKKQTRELDKSISDIARKRIRGNSDALQSLMKSFLEILDLHVADIDYQVSISIAGAWGYFFGAGRDVIMQEVRSIINKMFSNRAIDNFIGNIKQPATNLLAEFGSFATKITTPLLNALENALNMQEEGSSQQEDIAPKIAACEENMKKRSAFLQEVELFFHQYSK